MIDVMSLKGQYEISIIEDGQVVETRIITNTITDDGMELLFDYLTGRSRMFLSYIALGLGETAASTSDTDLVHEIFRGRIEAASYSTDDSQVTWHIGLLPSDAVGVINEIATFDKLKNEDSLVAGDLLLTDFDTDVDTFSADVGSLASDTTNYKEGESALKATTDAGSTPQTISLTKTLDLSAFEDADKFQILIYPYATTNLSNIKLRFETDGSNYYEATLSSFSATTWALKSVAKSAFSATGSPDWSDINTIKLIITQSAPSAIDITFDSLRIITVNTNSRCFSRQVLSPTVTKSSKQEALVTYTVTFA